MAGGSGISGYCTDAGAQDWIPVRVDSVGRLLISLGGADVQIGAVEIKDADSDLRAQVTAQGLQVFTAQALPAGTNNIGDVDEASVACAAADIATPAVNTPAVVTYAATPNVRHHITGMAWSYAGGIPVGGRLTIIDAGAIVFDIDIAEEGAGLAAFPKPKTTALVNSAMVITLAAGGAAITGKVSVLNHWAE